MKYPKAIRAIEQEISRLQSRIETLRLGAHALSGLSNHLPKRKSNLSVQARKRIAIAQRKRWAQWHKENKVSSTAKEQKTSGKV